jgi:hypothetical protein
MEIIIYVLGVVVMFMLALIVHESGHLISGLLVGFRFEMFVAGFLKIYRDQKRRIRIGINKDLSLFGGVAATTPRDISADNRKKFAMVILGGPIASLIFVFVFFGIASLFVEPWRFLFAIAGACSFGVFFGTIIPNKSGIFFTDRKRFQRLISRSETSEIEIALLNLVTLQSVENSMKNADYKDIETVKRDQDPFINLFAYYYEVMYHYDHASDLYMSVYKVFNDKAEQLSNPLIRSIHKELKKYLRMQD